MLAALGLMAKPMLVTLPCLLLVLDAWPYARLRSDTRPWFRDRQLYTRCIEKIPFFILAAICAWLTMIAQTDAMSSLDKVGFFYRLINSILSYATYIAVTIVPVEQSFMYTTQRGVEITLVGAALATLGLVSWWAAKKRGAVLAGWLWFLVTLVPVIGLIKVGVHARADRYMYMPMIGLLLILAGTISTERILTSLGVRGRRILGVMACAAVLALSFSAYRYAGYWRDSETLFKRALSVDPEDFVAHTMLTIVYEKSGQAQLCLLHAQALLRLLMPGSPYAITAAISASNAALSLNNHELARKYLEYAIQASPAHPVARYNMGTLELRAGNLTEAMTHFKLAIAVSPRYSEAYNNLGAALLQAGRKNEAIAAFSDAVRTDPDNKGARHNLERAGNGLSP